METKHKAMTLQKAKKMLKNIIKNKNGDRLIDWMEMTHERGYVRIWCPNENYPQDCLYIKRTPEQIIKAMKMLIRDKRTITHIESYY